MYKTKNGFRVKIFVGRLEEIYLNLRPTTMIILCIFKYLSIKSMNFASY